MRTAVRRDPRKDPRVGDVVRDGTGTFEVVHRKFGMVCYIFRDRNKFYGYQSSSIEDWIESSQENEVINVAKS